MTELRLNGNDGEYLLLESSTGEHFKLKVDDYLRNSIKGSGSRSTSTVQLSPREIQSEIRSGATVDQLVEKSGDSRSYIEKFAAPVLDELTHVIASALAVRISIAGDRYNDISHIEFGEIIASRLDASGVNSSDWSAVRDENHQWLVSVNFERDGSNIAATWSFDPKRLLLSPENELAITLSTQNTLGETAFAKLRSAPNIQEPQTSEPNTPPNLTESLADTQLVETAIPIGRANETILANRTESIEEEFEELATTTDLLDALKKKREERSTRQVDLPEPSEETRSIDLLVGADTVSYEPGEEPQVAPDDFEPKPAPTRRNGRPSIPSFDEIVQGTKSEEE